MRLGSVFVCIKSKISAAVAFNEDSAIIVLDGYAGALQDLDGEDVCHIGGLFQLCTFPKHEQPSNCSLTLYEWTGSQRLNSPRYYQVISTDLDYG